MNECFPNVCVVGAGHSGLAMAAHLKMIGCKVTLYNRSAKRLEPVIARGCWVELRGELNGRVQLDLVTTDPSTAVRDNTIVLVAVPASGHLSVAQTFAPYLSAGQAIILNPGRTFGALEFHQALRILGVTGVWVAETQTILYTSRSEGNVAMVAALKAPVTLAAYPIRDTKYVLSLLHPILPQFTAATTCLETSLGNVGMILHPLPMVMNAGWIEFPRSNFLYYYDAISPSVAKALQELDRERLRVARALGIQLPSVVEWMQMFYSATSDDLYLCIQETKPYSIVTAPTSLDHRYLIEDVSTGLVPLSDLARLLGVTTPLADATIRFASVLLGIDLYSVGRNASRLQLPTTGDAGALRAFLDGAV